MPDPHLTGPRRGVLVLSSRGVPVAVADHARGTNAALISNAMDCAGPGRRADKHRRDTTALTAAGFTTAPLDLRRHHHTQPDRLREALDGVDVVWLGGGNTFGLLHQMHRSGFAALLPELLDDGVLYAGESAGAVAAGSSLDGVDRVDDPRASPDPTLPPLGLVDYLPWPHWRPGPDPQDLDQRHYPMPGTTAPLYRLRDGEHLVVTDGLTRLGLGPAASTDPGLLTLF